MQAENDKQTKRFVYQKFREPIANEYIHKYVKEFINHLENEFERLADELQLLIVGANQWKKSY